jgi:hypothetical protein
MPVTGLNIWSVSLKSHFFLSSWEIKHFSSSIVRAWSKLNGTQWEWKVSNASISMSLKPVLVSYLMVWVYYNTFLISWN